MNKKNKYLQYLRYSKSIEWTNFLIKKAVPITDFRYDKVQNTIFIRSVNHSFAKNDFPVFFDGYEKYCWKFLDNGLQFVFKGEEMFVQKNALIIKVETLEELFIISEVFIEHMYKVESTENYTVIDIGMNVGITSLYLSQFENIKAIYGFEPFKQTYDCAIKNIGMNSEAMAKIKTFNYGLSNADKVIELAFDPLAKGNLGIKEAAADRPKGQQKEKVEFRNAGNAIAAIVKENAERGFIVKMDCEGSEYDIIDNLKEASVLDAIDIYMIEWHNIPGYKSRLTDAIQFLRKKNFLVLTLGSLQNETGMLYCFNTNNKNHKIGRV